MLQRLNGTFVFIGTLNVRQVKKMCSIDKIAGVVRFGNARAFPMNSITLFILIYFAAISLLAVVLTVRDKNAARKNAWRIKELTLFVIAVLGGSMAMLLAMLAVRHKTRHKRFMVGIPLIILIQLTIVATGFNQSLCVSRFSIKTDKTHGQVKLALVCDLHSCDYGDGQSVLLKAIDAEQPDAVLMCGDIFDDRLPPGNTIEFLDGIAAKYPCYYVSGNHEFWSRKADDFKNILMSYGVVVLEGTFDIFEAHGESIRICGIDDPDTDRYPSRSVSYAEQMKQLGESSDSNRFTVLLSHRPERIEELLPLNPDIVLSGHAHGGQWQIPYLLVNGLLSPNQGLFPSTQTANTSLMIHC